MLKKFLMVFTVALMIMNAVLPLQVFAGNGISDEGRICRDLGILKGDTGVVDSEYLQKRPNRIQAAIMFLRLKGLEEEALSYSGTRNFKDADVIVWKEGRNLLSYLKAHPELGWIGDGTNFLPLDLIDSKQYYKVLLETLGYKQKVDGVGDYSWEEVYEFAESKGLKKVADVRSFTVNSLAIATVEALNTPMKNSRIKLVQHLVDNGTISRYDAEDLGLLRRVTDVEVKSVRAISNSKVEVVFEDSVDSSQVLYEDMYDFGKLDIEDINIKNDNAVIIDTEPMNEGTTYTVEIDGRSYSFRGLKKDNQAPKLIAAECKDTDLVELSFDRILDNVTAQDEDTYSIDGVRIKSARLDATNTKVRLVTEGIQANKSYEVKISNIKNGDGVVTKQIKKRFTGRKDTTAPKLNKLTVLNNTRLLLEFNDNNGLNKDTAEDIDNYRITSSSGDLEVVSAQVKDRDDDGLWDSVELKTESQEPGRQYTLRINNISDDSVLRNKISREIKKEFRGKSRDKTGPTIAQKPRAITNTMIEIVFDDANALDISTACDIDNYDLDGDLEIEDIRIKNKNDLYSTAGRTVLITTSEMEKSESYTIVISGITDEFGNEMKSSASKKYRFRGAAEDRTPPYIVSVDCINSRTIELKFDDSLDEESAENIVNYRIDGLALVTKAELKSDEKTVVLSVSSLSSDRNHKIVMNNIKDLAGNALSNVSVSVLYGGYEDDDDPPEVSYIDAENEYEIWVNFDEEIHAEGARLKASGLTFRQVGSLLDGNKTIVMRAESPMKDKEYEVTSITNVWDISGNAYKLESGLDFYGNDSENDPPEVDYWDQIDVRTFRVVFTEPVILLDENDISGVKNPSGVSIKWDAELNPEDEDTIEGYSTVDFIASKQIPADKEFRFNFTAIIEDYGGKRALDDNDKREGDSNVTILESYLEDDEDPYIEYVEAITSTKVQVVFNEAMGKPGSYKIYYWDDDNNKKNIGISAVEVDSEDKNRINIFTKDKMSSKYIYTLVPVASASDIAGNRLDDDEEFDFEGSDIVVKDYIQGVVHLNNYAFRVSKSSTISKVTSVVELGSNNNDNLISKTERVDDNTVKVIVGRPLLEDVRYEVTVDGLKYTFSGSMENGDIELEIPELEITYDDMDFNEHFVVVKNQNNEELNVVEGKNCYIIKDSVRNGDILYIYVKRADDKSVIYGTRVEVEGMSLASSSKEIISFGFNNLYPDAVSSIDEKNGIIKVSVPYGTNVKNLAAAFKCSHDAIVKVGSKIQVSGQSINDFSDEVIYTVIAQDGSTAHYRVIVTVEESKYEKKIKSFVFGELKPEAEGVIDEENHEITVQLPRGTELKALRPTIVVSPGTTVFPKSGDAIDFYDPVIYKVIAADGSEQRYTVKVTVDASSDNYIESFRFEGIEGQEVNIEAGRENTIRVRVPYKTDINLLKPIIKVSEGATVNPESGEINNFTDEVIYTVTAEDGTVRKYTVKVTVDASSDNYIESFRFEGIEGQEVNIEEGKENTIRVRVPYKTDIDSLKPIIKVSEGATVNPESGEINNFTDEVIYTVTAEDGTVRKYTVKVTVDTSSDNYIESFRFEGIEGQEVNIEEGKENTIRVKVPYNTDIDWLKPIIKVSEGATVDPESEETQDFSKPFVYVVTAADGSEREYTVHVEKELNSEKKILSFSFKELDTLFEADINEKGKTIEVTLPNGTDTTDLIAYFEASPEAVVKVGEIEQVSGKTRNNFTETVIYTVMAQDGSTEDYAVTVTVEKSSEKYIKEFGFDVPKAAGIIDEEKRTIYVTVPYGTELNGLKAVFRSSDYSTVMVGKTEQKSGVTENNFAEPVKYTVVAQDGSTREYIVTVSAALAGDKKMLDYNLKVGENNIKAMIDESSHKIILAVPHGTNLENLTASFIYVGKSITIGGVPQISGMTPNSFAENVVYTITAHDETTTDYTVIVTVK